MGYTVRDLQARCAALGFDPKGIDGIRGRNTNAAVASACAFKGVKYESQLFHVSGLHRVHWHWTASGYVVSTEIASHYNGVSDFQGISYDGGARPEHQADYRAGSVGVSHTLNANTGAIGEAVAAMRGAKDYPFSWGDSPLNWEMIDAMLCRTAQHCRDFDIPVSRYSTLSHAEIQPTLGITQNGKWDFSVLPEMDKVSSAIVVGDILRERMKKQFM
jgi:hypothetical protein